MTKKDKFFQIIKRYKATYIDDINFDFMDDLAFFRVMLKAYESHTDIPLINLLRIVRLTQLNISSP